MKTRTNSFKNGGILALIVLSITGGLMAVLARYLGSGLGVYEQWYLRYGVAFLASLILFYKNVSFRKYLHLPYKEWLLLLFRVIVGQIIGLGLFTLASEKALPGIVTFMQVMPVIAILGIIVLHERLTWQKSLITLLSFSGAAFIVVNNVHDVGSLNIGAILSLISAIFYSLMLITRKWHSGILSNRELTVIFLGLSFISTYILSIILYRRWIIPESHWSLNFSLVIIAAGLLSVIINLLINYSFERVSAVVAGNILTLEELFGPLFGYIFYREVLTIREVLGGLIILASVLLMNRVVDHEHGKVTLPVVVPD